ncbi:MAG: D-Ala-D-Ala carboxypeptidase family metallohydrolase [Burkholderiales bacterium]
MWASSKGAHMDWSRYPNFLEAEFRCKHTAQCCMQPEFMSLLQTIRTEYGKPMTITSGYRHWSHPVEVKKGHKNGEHTMGTCADIACASGAERFELVRLALKHGISRIGIANNFVHLGIGGANLPKNVIWEYS